MRVILKPGGAALFALLLISLIGVISVRMKRNAVPTPAATGTAAPATDAPGTGILKDDMEQFTPFKPTPVQRARITGDVAVGMYDNTDWADLSLAYSKDTTNPHGGGSCQKIAVGKIISGQVQYIGPFTAKSGTKVRASLWIRSDTGLGPHDVTLALRQRSDEANWYAQTDVAPDARWHKFEVVGVVTRPDETYFMVLSHKSGTNLYVDDLEITRIP